MAEEKEPGHGGRGVARAAGPGLPAKPAPGPVPPMRDKPALRRAVPARPVELPPEALPAMPQRRAPRDRLASVLFLLVVAVPALAIAVYYYFVATDRYVAEFRFAVTEMNPILPGTNPTASNSGSPPGGLASMLSGYAVSNAAMQNYVVVDFLSSRQCVEELWNKLHIAEMYSKPGIDWWSRFAAKGSKEKFVEYWQKMVTTSYDPVTGLAFAQVSAFSPQDALRIAETMVKLAEELVNRIALRAQLDAVKFAEAELTRAEERMKNIRVELLTFRLQEGMIDPTTSAVSPNIALAQQMRSSILMLETELSSLMKQSIDANAPSVRVLKSKIAASKQELDRVMREVTQDRKGSKPLAEVMAQFEKLDLERQYASNMLISAQQALDTARGNAAAQHLYMTPHVRPSLPESSTEPRRGSSVLIATVVLLGMWLALLTVVRAVKDHTA